MNPEQRNYQKELEAQLKKNQMEGKKPSLLLHCCCAPCASYVLEYLKQEFAITCFYYNPNIFPEEEHVKRAKELERMIQSMNETYPGEEIRLVIGEYELEKFYKRSIGLEEEKEGGRRCFLCYALRLQETAKVAFEGAYDFFTTTLTISPLKNAQRLNEIGEALAKQGEAKWLPSDFKKKNGYKRSVELSKQYGLYRQNYCGCEFSARDREIT